MGTFGQIEDDGDELQPVRRTGLDFIRAVREEKKKAAIRTAKLRDTQRPEFELVCRVPSDMDELLGVDEKAEEYAKQPGAPRYNVILAAMTLARFTQRLTCNGMPVSEGDGSPFADPALQDEVGTRGQAGASWRTVREVFITDGGAYDDGYIARLSDRLAAESGITRNSVVVGSDEDPT